MRKPLVAGNWKMHGSVHQVSQLLESLLSLQSEVSQAELAVFPPFTYLLQCQQLLSNTSIAWGGQNVSDQAPGAFTGEVSADMLLDLGCQYVIVGHSERRTLYKESNEMVAAKFAAALKAGLRPIVCVGESLEARESGETLSIVQQQLAAVLSLADNLPSLEQAVIAYEPIWAIGTGKVATPGQAQTVHAAIREQLAQWNADLAKRLRILYGGSVKPDNAAAIFAMPDIDGALVGGASLKAEQFIEIGKQCNN